MSVTQQRYTPEQVIEALRAARGLKAVAAQALRCHRDTVDHYCKRYKSVQAEIDAQRQVMTDIAEGALFKKISDGEAWAVCFYLKTQGRERGYIERTETELRGPGGGPVEFTLRLGESDHGDRDSD